MIKLCGWTVAVYGFLVLASGDCLAIPLTSWKNVLNEPTRRSPMIPINGTISSLPRLLKTFPIDNTANLFPAARPIPRITPSRIQVFFRGRTGYLPEFQPLPDETTRRLYDDGDEYQDSDVAGPAKNKSTPSGRTRFRASKDKSQEFLMIGSSAIGGFLGGCITTGLMMMAANKKKNTKVATDRSPTLTPSLMEALLAISEKSYPITDSPGHRSQHHRPEVKENREYRE